MKTIPSAQMISSSPSRPGYVSGVKMTALPLWLTRLQDWSERVDFGNMDGYREKFEKIQTYFEPRFAQATKLGNEMIKTIEENLNSRKNAQSG